MKNAFIALAFVLVVSTAFASLSSETKARLQKINSNSFGRTILQTIQVELQTREDPRPQIVTILRQIEEELITEQQVADEAHNDAVSAHEDNIERIDNRLEELEDTISGLRATQDELTQTLGQERENFAQQSSSLENFRTQLANAEAASEASQEHWETENRRLTHVIEVLDEVRAVITERLASRFNPEFIQTSHKQLLANLAQVKDKINAKGFKKSSPGFHKLALFIAMKVENTLRDEDADEEAQAALTSIVTVIDGLKAGFEAERTAQESLNQANQETFEETSSDLNAAIVETTSALDNLSNDITHHQETLSQTIDAIAAAVSESDGLTEERVTAVASFEQAEDNFRTVTHDRTDQLTLIQEVLDIVQNQLTGLRQYAEDYLASH